MQPELPPSEYEETPRVYQKQVTIKLPEAGKLKPATVFNPKGHITGKNPCLTTVIDLTHDCPSELAWRPIKRVPELKPPEAILKDKINLKEWEQ